MSIFALSLARRRSQRRVREHLELLPEVPQIPLPVAMLAKPGECAWEGRIAPAVRDPGRMMKHPQGAQRLDQGDFPDPYSAQYRNIP